MSVLQSKELSSDLKQLHPSLSSTLGKWKEYDPLLLKLLSFIPPTLPYSRLTELDPQLGTTQSLPSLLYEELCLHNSSLIQLHSSLRELFTFTSGDALFTSQTGLALKSIRDNHIPTAWKSLLPFPLGECAELVPALNLLKCRMEFYTRALENGNGGCDPLLTEFEPYLFSSVQDMISRILQTSSSCSQIDANVKPYSFTSVLNFIIIFLRLFYTVVCIISMQLIIEGFPVHPYPDSDVPSIILRNLCLHGARWDRQTEQLSSLGDGEQSSRGPTRCSVLLTLKPSPQPHSKATTVGACGTCCYDCPLLLVTSGSVREATVQSAPRLCTVPLSCSSGNCSWPKQPTARTPEGQGTSPEELVSDNCPAIFLSCEWPT